jgi:hypothetical protein
LSKGVGGDDKGAGRAARASIAKTRSKTAGTRLGLKHGTPAAQCASNLQLLGSASRAVMRSPYSEVTPMKTLLLNKEDVGGLISMKEVIGTVRIQGLSTAAR